MTRYVLTDGRLGRDVVRGDLVLCFVYRPVGGLGEKPTPGLTVKEVGRTTKLAVARLQNPRLFQLIPPPYVLRRTDGTETAVG